MPKLIDLTGKTYNRLTVIKRDTERSGVYWICRWECKCHACGSVTVKTASWLKKYKSCGCLEKAAGFANVDKLHQTIIESGSNPSILRKAPNSNNFTTGVRGVTYNASSGKYIAYISYQKKRYTLCRSTDINKCIKARKNAEKAIHADFLAWLEDNKEV